MERGEKSERGLVVLIQRELPLADLHGAFFVVAVVGAYGFLSEEDQKVSARQRIRRIKRHGLLEYFASVGVTAHHIERHSFLCQRLSRDAALAFYRVQMFH